MIVNEFGKIGLDHLLLEQVEEGVLLLDSGCVCCTIRSDLQETIHDLQQRSANGSIPQFSRVFVETTGLADPAPILSTVLAEPMIRNHFRTGNVVCTFDALAGSTTVESHVEASKQIAVAERILLTKSDLATSEQLSVAEDLLSSLNPFAEITRTTGQGFDALNLFGRDVAVDQDRPDEVRKWLNKARSRNVSHSHHTHSKTYNSFVVDVLPSINWTMFAIWLTALLHRHGDRILRIKGILNVDESETPVVMHCVQHVVHPPMHISEWPDEANHSRLVFITKGIEKSIIQRSLNTFLRLADQDVANPDRVKHLQEGAHHV